MIFKTKLSTFSFVKEDSGGEQHDRIRSKNLCATQCCDVYKNTNNEQRFINAKHRRYNPIIRQSSTIAFALGILLQPNCSTMNNSAVSAFTVVKQPHSHDIKRIVFGTAAITKASMPLELLDEAFAKGFRRFDLARTYGGGESERIFGEWMKTRNIDRSTVDIITKGGMGKDKYGSPDRPMLTKRGLFDEVKSSLEALNTDVVDLYMFHRDDVRISAAEHVIWANELIKSGSIKRWGVSNWSFERFCDAHEFALRNDMIPPTSNSPQFSLAVPMCEVWPTTQSVSSPEHVKQIQWYEENNIELLCWEVLAKGFMAKPDLWPAHEVDSTTFHTPVEEGTDEWRVQRIQRAYCNEENYRRRDLAIELAKACGCKLSQVAVMYPLSMGKHVSVIFGSTNANHLDDMVSLQHLYLDDEAMYRLAGVKPKRMYSLSPFETEGSAANNIRRFSGRSAMFPNIKKNGSNNVNTNVMDGATGTEVSVEKKKKLPVKERFRLYSFRPSI